MGAMKRYLMELHEKEIIEDWKAFKRDGCPACGRKVDKFDIEIAESSGILMCFSCYCDDRS
jgi:hypothetical protein